MKKVMMYTYTRRVVSFFTAVLLMLTALLSFASCRGDSAYDIAVKNGFEGSEKDWLESLAGKDGKDGNDGENGTNGEDGKNGISSGADVSISAAAALRTAVIIFSNYEKSEYAGYGKDPIITSYEEFGAGIIYKLDRETGDAYIVTNYHVIYDKYSNSKGGVSEDIELFLYGMHYEEMKINATFVGGSMTYDIAVLKVTGSDLLKTANVDEITLADSDRITAGSLAIAIGNPDGDGMSLTSGVVSRDCEYIRMQSVDGVGTDEMRVMRVDCPLNYGNSGGGLYTNAGSLIGLVCAKIDAQDFEGIGYAVPSNIVGAVAEKIISQYENSGSGVLYKPTLGINVQTTESHSELDSELMKTFVVETVKVSQIGSGSVTDGILKVGDRLISLSCGERSKDITRRFSVIDFILSLRSGDTLVFKIERNGEILERSIVLDDSLFVSVK